MKKLLSALLALALTACSSPNDIVLGPDPLKQIAEQGDKFKSMPEQDRMLLVGYLTVSQMGSLFGAEAKPATGRTVGEVMVDARAWKQKVLENEAAAKKRDDEAKALKAKVEAERKAIADQIDRMVTFAVVEKIVIPKNFDAGRFEPTLLIKFALENKADKSIRQIKGVITFADATGDKVGDLRVDFDETIQAKEVLKSAVAWKINPYISGDVQKVADRDLSLMTGKFVPRSIAFVDGEVLKAPD